MNKRMVFVFFLPHFCPLFPCSHSCSPTGLKKKISDCHDTMMNELRKHPVQQFTNLDVQSKKILKTNDWSELLKTVRKYNSMIQESLEVLQKSQMPLYDVLNLMLHKVQVAPESSMTSESGMMKASKHKQQPTSNESIAKRRKQQPTSNGPSTRSKSFGENKKFALYAGKRVAWGKFLPTSVESVLYDVNPQNEKKTVAFINGMEFNMDGWVGFNK